MPADIKIENGTLVRYIRADAEKSEKIVIPDGVTCIGSYAFDERALRSWWVSDPVIPPSVKKIDAHAFDAVWLALSEIHIPGTVLEIGDFALRGRNLATATLNEGLEKLGSKVFYGQKKLKKLYLPTTLSYIAEDAFENCSKQLKFYVSTEECYAARYLQEHNYEIHLLKGAKKKNPQKSEKQSVQEEPEGCLSSQKVDSVDSIQFFGKTFVHTGFSKKDGEEMENKIAKLGGVCRSSVSNQTDYLVVNLEYTKKTTTKYRTAIELRESGKNQKICIISADQLKKAFLSQNTAVKTFVEGMKYLTSEDDEIHEEEFEIHENRLVRYLGNRRNVRIPEGVEYIGVRAFKGRTNIRKVHMSDSVRRLGGECFFGCTNLQQVTLSKTLEEIGPWAFADCTHLEEITIPEGVTRIGKIAFGWCYSLRRVHLPASINFMDDAAFGDPAPNDLTVFAWAGTYAYEYLKNNGIKRAACDEGNILCVDKQYKIHYDVLEEGIQINHVFFEEGADEVILPDSIGGIPVISLGAECFKKTKVKTVKLPGNLVRIGEGCFEYCPHLKSIVIPDTVTDIGGSCFESCEELENVTLSNTLKVVPNYAFAFCSNLRQIVVPESVKEIGIQAFRGCKKLSKIFLSESLDVIDYEVFSGCEEITISCIQDGIADQYAKFYGMRVEYSSTVKGEAHCIKINKYYDSWGKCTGGTAKRIVD